jgi:GT2 family glycosyltransferase
VKLLLREDKSARSVTPAAEPVVSIVTPCLNPGTRLARCVESVAAQTYGHIEHIVVDGGSTDGTVEWLTSARGIRWLSEPDRGQAEAINKGFGIASGAILTWLNMDDVLMPSAVERAVDAFAREPALGLVYGDCRIVENGEDVLNWRAPKRLTARSIEGGTSIPQPGAFVTRWALERVGGLNESFELAMDVDLWLRLVAAGIENRRIPGVVSIFELHSGSKSGSLPRREFYEETARAFVFAGLPHSAALSLGQGAAAASAVNGRVVRERLEGEIRLAQEAGRQSVPPLSASTIRAAATAEAGVIELRVSLAGLRYLLAPEVWRDGAIRRRLRAAVRRGTPQVVRRLARRARRGGQA